VKQIKLKSINSKRQSDINQKSPASFRGASITIEAALTIPLFFFAVVAFLYLFEISAISTSVKSGLQYAAKETASQKDILPALLRFNTEKLVVEGIGEDRLMRSIVVGGKNGIDCSGSNLWSGDGIYELKASYKIKLPVPVFNIPELKYSESIRVKEWSGYSPSWFHKDEETVYVAEYGIVYHKNYYCPYLNPSIKPVTSGQLSSLRNKNGAKYYKCERCGASLLGIYYVTDYGDRYHSSLNCSGLKRTIYAVKKSEVGGKGACSKCAK
jgi:hypothetical protein